LAYRFTGFVWPRSGPRRKVTGVALLRSNLQKAHWTILRIQRLAITIIFECRPNFSSKDHKKWAIFAFMNRPENSKVGPVSYEISRNQCATLRWHHGDIPGSLLKPGNSSFFMFRYNGPIVNKQSFKGNAFIVATSRPRSPTYAWRSRQCTKFRATTAPP